MTKKEFTKKILAVECAGFLIVIIILWMDEILDIPAVVFGGQPTPINYTESLFETVLVVALAACVIIMTARLLQRIRYLEGILSIQAGDNHRIVEQKLKAFISPKVLQKTSGGNVRPLRSAES